MEAIALKTKLEDIPVEFIESLEKEHPKLKVGQKIEFTGGYYENIRFQTEVLGFDKEGCIYVLWDSYWFPIRDEEERNIVVL